MIHIFNQTLELSFEQSRLECFKKGLLINEVYFFGKRSLFSNIRQVDLSCCYLVSWLLKQGIVMATYFGESCHTCRIHIRFRPWHSIHSWGDSSAGRGCTDSECDGGSRQPITDGCLQSEAIDGPKRKIASVRSNGPWHV